MNYKNIAPAGRSASSFDPACAAAANRFVAASRELSDRSAWNLRMFASLNLFLWHLKAFARSDDPRPGFVAACERAIAVIEAGRGLAALTGEFPPLPDDQSLEFESAVSGLFSDIWVDMTDDIYFDETYRFTRERLEKSGVDPEALFGGKVVVDGGCGSGKFSAAIARLGAAKVIGLDIGQKGLDFAVRQAAKVPYGSRLDYRHASLLDIPLENASVDMVWSNGVIHHTLDYERCVREFARILKPGGQLFLYVNGSFGLFELLQETVRKANVDIPRSLFQAYIKSLGVNSGRLYWLMDCLYAPYEYKHRAEVVTMLERNGFTAIRQLLRGVASDQIEQVSAGVPYAEVKYGEAQLKFLCTKAA